MRTNDYRNLVIVTIGYIVAGDNIPALVLEGVLTSNTLDDYLTHIRMTPAHALTMPQVVGLFTQLVDIVDFFHKNKIVLCTLSCMISSATFNRDTLYHHSSCFLSSRRIVLHASNWDV